MYCMQCFLKSKYIKSRTFNDKNRWIIKKVVVLRSCFNILLPGALTPLGIEGAMKHDVSKHWCTLQWCASRGWFIAHENRTSCIAGPLWGESTGGLCNTMKKFSQTNKCMITWLWMINSDIEIDKMLASYKLWIENSQNCFWRLSLHPQWDREIRLIIRMVFSDNPIIHPMINLIINSEDDCITPRTRFLEGEVLVLLNLKNENFMIMMKSHETVICISGLCGGKPSVSAQFR